MAFWFFFFNHKTAYESLISDWSSDVCSSDLAASFAMLGDINLAEPEALIGFAGPRVIEQTVRETLPEGFQRSEFLLDHGAIDQICDRRELRDRIATLLALLMRQPQPEDRSEEHTSELQSLMRISYAVSCLKKTMY